MILKALFGNNKDQASPQQQQQAPPFVFSPDNEFFLFGELVTAELTYHDQLSFFKNNTVSFLKYI